MKKHTESLAPNFNFYLNQDGTIKEMSHVQALRVSAMNLCQCSDDQIKKHCHELLRTHHPDKNTRENQHKAHTVTTRINAAIEAIHAIQRIVQRTYADLACMNLVHAITSTEATNLAVAYERVVLRESTSMPGKVVIHAPDGQMCIFGEYIFRNPEGFVSQAKTLETMTILFGQQPLPATVSASHSWVDQVMTRIHETGFVHEIDLTSEQASELACKHQQVVLRKSTSFVGKIAIHYPNGTKGILDDTIKSLYSNTQLKGPSLFANAGVNMTVQALFNKLGTPVLPNATATASHSSSSTKP